MKGEKNSSVYKTCNSSVFWLWKSYILSEQPAIVTIIVIVTMIMMPIRCKTNRR